MMEKWDLYDQDGNKIDKKAHRGDVLEPGEYHLVVSAFIKNSKGDYLISRRSKKKNGGGRLETVGGAALEGEDSQAAILREIHEEIGLDVSAAEMTFLKRLKFNSKASYFFDIWMVEKEAELEKLSLQVEEVEEVMWVDRESVEKMINDALFFNYKIYKEILDLGVIL
jgi:isopentenyldiphosphate isomerase